MCVGSELNCFFPCTCGSSCRVKREQLGSHDWFSTPVPSGQHWLLVQGLESETAYQFSVLAQNKLGTGPFSEVVTVNTLGGLTKSGLISVVVEFCGQVLEHDKTKVFIISIEQHDACLNCFASIHLSSQLIE